MKKSWWIALSVILLFLNIFQAIELKHLKKHSFPARVSLEGLDRRISLPYEQSLLTLIIYFSQRSCIGCMEESYYWNKLFLDLPKEEISILGIIPEKENVEKTKDINKILFPVLNDKGGRFAEKFHISITPFKIILDIRGNCLYMSPSFPRKESQENFYFDVLELLRKIRIKE